MAGNSFGKAFRITTAGESHGPGNVVIIDGCPPGLELSEQDLLTDLARRKPGQSAVVTQRQEEDLPEILSGVFGGKTTGTSIAVLIRNADQRSRDYDAIKDLYRPGHADFTYDMKYGERDYRGGGRSSARETVARVAAGAIAKKLIARDFGGSVVAYTKQIGSLVARIEAPESVTLEAVEWMPDGSPNVVRCPDHSIVPEMVALIDEVRRDTDSIGGVAEIVAVGVPAGLGEPVFDKLKADLGKALFSLPAVLGVEYGAGFAVATARGSQNNDIFVTRNTADTVANNNVSSAGNAGKASDAGNAGKASDAGNAIGLGAATNIATLTNRHGGMLGGISSGMPILLRAAIKPTSSLARPQATVRRDGEAATMRTLGRHDPCLLPRFAPMGEAMVALVIADHWLRWRAQCSSGRR